ncbi:MAG: diphosphate--fructose-6-phosphate 1-phosphotransferase [Acidobacteria bacterium]|nr:MAG: diphosphate--fructose-6-phosphate 1-phosphotransferase [Acidobacteriota bacterium]
MSENAVDFLVKNLGKREFSAFDLPGLTKMGISHFFVDDKDRIPLNFSFLEGQDFDQELAFERAGAREKLYFNASKTKAGIVTCGGICPGINDVIRALVMNLYHLYGVKSITGFQYGYAGLNPANGLYPIMLEPSIVKDIHTTGGSMLGSSRGAVDPDIMVETLRRLRINILFTIGGDGTQTGAHLIYEAAQKKGYKLSVIGVPKTIDNDINYVHKTFGLDTAVEVGRNALDCAHTEARGAMNGIGLVKVMGRDSGYIAALSALASFNVNYVLVPEVPFDLEGEGALLEHLENRLRNRGHAVIVVAEGAGMHLIEDRNTRLKKDKSGNILHSDIGVYLKERIKDYFSQREMEHTVKYIDPSYTLRSIPANANDSIFAGTLAHNAVHAAMAGKTDIIVGSWYNQFVHVPIPLAIKERKKIDPNGVLWMNVLQATGMPSNLVAK